MKRIGRLLSWAAPPLAFLAWAIWTISGQKGAAIPAFGPVEPHLAAWRWSLLYRLGMGGLLLLGWTGVWAWLKGSRSGDKRPRADSSLGGRRMLG